MDSPWAVRDAHRALVPNGNFSDATWATLWRVGREAAKWQEGYFLWPHIGSFRNCVPNASHFPPKVSSGEVVVLHSIWAVSRLPAKRWMGYDLIGAVS